MSRRGFILFTVALLSLGLFAAPAFAAVNFRSGPTFTDEGTTLNVRGDVSGLGNEDLTVQLTAEGTASVVCVNPGGNRAPGQDTSVVTSGSQEDIEVKNGRARFNFSTDEPADPNPAEVCPNRSWDAQITDVDFTSATLTLIQGGEVVFQQTYQL